jgi:hypothetical protein
MLLTHGYNIKFNIFIKILNVRRDHNNHSIEHEHGLIFTAVVYDLMHLNACTLLDKMKTLF